MSNTRVRKPPGGDSSFNIFGIATEPNEKKKAAENNSQKATDNSTQKATDNSSQKSTGTEEPHVNTDDMVAKEEETIQKAEDAPEDDKEKLDVVLVEEENEKEPKDTADQNTTDAAPASVDVKDSPAKGENQNTLENTKSKQKAAYNPITGEPYGSSEVKPEAAKSVGHTRVRQPPGGASSKLW